MESLEYEKDETTLHQVENLAGDYVRSLKEMPADKIRSRKEEAKRVNSAFNFLAKFNLVPSSFAPKAEIEGLIKEQMWDKK